MEDRLFILQNFKLEVLELNIFRIYVHAREYKLDETKTLTIVIMFFHPYGLLADIILSTLNLYLII